MSVVLHNKRNNGKELEHTHIDINKSSYNTKQTFKKVKQNAINLSPSSIDNLSCVSIPISI